jgi:Outer membrane protein beta-barrel domain
MTSSRSRYFSHLRTLSVLLCGLAAATIAAEAQTGIYVEFGGSKVDAPNNQWVYGPTFGGYHDFYGPIVHLGADLRASVLGISQTTTLTSGEIGPRVSIHPRVLPVMPYVEALAGLGHYDFGTGPGTSSTQFEYQFLAGVDYTLIPRLDWRVVEFSYGGLSVFNGNLHPKTISTGLVLRLP